MTLYAPGLSLREARDAFVRGRHSDNLYGESLTPELLATPVGDVRPALRLDGG